MMLVRWTILEKWSFDVIVHPMVECLRYGFGQCGLINQGCEHVGYGGVLVQVIVYR